MTVVRTPSSLNRQAAAPTAWVAALVFIAGTFLTTESLQSWLSSRNLATQFVSSTTWARWAAAYSRPHVPSMDGVAEIDFVRVGLAVAVVHALTWLVGTGVLSWWSGADWRSMGRRWGTCGGLWWCCLGLWDWISIGCSLLGATSAVSLWGLFPAQWCALCLAGWLTTAMVFAGAGESANRQAIGSAKTTVWAMVATSVVVFVTMNWRLYFNLLIPHGDSAMYEEHLWNILHGKGFRSYLDQGLFLGEHIQVVHLALLPIYVVFPSHLTMEACESLALALGAWPVYWMARRHTGSDRAGIAAAAAYLLYPPMQFLDIEIDLKTFRPEAFGIPIFLLTLDQLDRRHLWGTLLGLLACLTVKEDYAVVLGPLGVWIAVIEGGRRKEDGGRGWDAKWFLFGSAIAVGSAAYLFLATRVLMPWFRSGDEIHYVRYFPSLGKTPEEIIRNVMANPTVILGELFSTSTALYACAMLLPFAFLPLLSPSRLAVGLPLFAILCLNELPQSRNPQHQFHAPLVPIVCWALAAAWPRAISLMSRWLKLAGMAESAVMHLTWTSACAMCLFFSLSPLSLTFWDTGSEWHWQRLYAPSQRALEFAKIADLIPRSARVASTDFVHPRYTHFERSYDYSGYHRKVSNYEQKVPDDTDYIVIDTQHRYSEIKVPKDVPEYRDHPETWELLPDRTSGYFIVLKRIH